MCHKCDFYRPKFLSKSPQTATNSENQYKGIWEINAPDMCFEHLLKKESGWEESLAIWNREKEKVFLFVPSLTFTTLCAKWWISYKTSDLSELAFSFIPSTKLCKLPCHCHTAWIWSKTIFTIPNKKGFEKMNRKSCGRDFNRLKHQTLLRVFFTERAKTCE